MCQECSDDEPRQPVSDSTPVERSSLRFAVVTATVLLAALIACGLLGQYFASTEDVQKALNPEGGSQTPTALPFSEKALREFMLEETSAQRLRIEKEPETIPEALDIKPGDIMEFFGGGGEN